MNLQDLTNLPLSVATVMLLGRIIPPQAGYWLADRLAGLMASRTQSEMVKAIQLNQQGVAQGKLTSAELTQVGQDVLRSTARCIYDYYHLVNQPQKMLRQITLSPMAREALDRTHQKRPAVLVTPHISNFDLMGRALYLIGYRYLILSYPNPNQGYRMQNWLRIRYGQEIAPMSISALRAAKQRLKSGGCVLTGLDRPLANQAIQKYRPRFFGKPANLPVAYIRLALEANVPIIVLSCTTLPDGSYHLIASHPLDMVPAADLQTAIIQNAENVLDVAGEMIQQYHTQWSMFYRVWEGETL